MGHLLTAAVLHPRLTGKDRLPAVAQRIGDFGHRAFTEHEREAAHSPPLNSL